MPLSSPAIRTLSFLSSAGLCTALGARLEWITFALFSSHYAVGFYASRHRLVRIGTSGSVSAQAIFAALLVAGLSVYLFFRPAWIVVFGIHHVLSETYGVRNRATSALPPRFYVAKALCESFLYVAILRFHPYILALAIPRGLMLLWGGGSFAWYATQLSRLEPARRRDPGVCSLVGVGALGVSCFYPITLTHFVVYHVVSWLFLPLKNPASSFAKIFLGHAITFASFLALTPAFGVGVIDPNFLKMTFSAFAFAHVLLSFALSASNPKWIASRFENGFPAWRFARAD